MDLHVHFECSMLTPAGYAAAVVPRGTTTVFVDPHELANVAGLDGVRYAIDASAGCRCATDPGAVVRPAGAGPRAVRRTTSTASTWPRCSPGSEVEGVAEVMDMLGVLGRSPRMVDVVNAGLAGRQDHQRPCRRAQRPPSAGLPVLGHLLGSRDLHGGRCHREAARRHDRRVAQRMGNSVDVDARRDRRRAQPAARSHRTWWRRRTTCSLTLLEVWHRPRPAAPDRPRARPGARVPLCDVPRRVPPAAHRPRCRRRRSPGRHRRARLAGRRRGERGVRRRPAGRGRWSHDRRRGRGPERSAARHDEAGAHGDRRLPPAPRRARRRAPHPRDRRRGDDAVGRDRGDRARRRGRRARRSSRSGHRAPSRSHRPDPARGIARRLGRMDRRRRHHRRPRHPQPRGVRTRRGRHGARRQHRDRVGWRCRGRSRRRGPRRARAAHRGDPLAVAGS